MRRPEFELVDGNGRSLFLRAILTFAVIVLGCTSNTDATTCKRKDNPSAKCGIRGVVKRDILYPLYGGQIVDTVNDCAVLCGRRRLNSSIPALFNGGRCVSFQFDMATNRCRLGAVSVKKGVDPKPASTKMFYDIGCYDCGDYCDQPYGVQLLDNGGFQQDLFGPWSAGDGEIVSSSDGQRYYRCLTQAKPHETANGCFLWQTFNICPEQLYMLEFNYLILTGNSTVKTRMQVGFGVSAYIETLNTNSSAWKTTRLYTVPFKDNEIYERPATFVFERFIVIGTNGHELYMDNVSVARIPVKPPLKQPVLNIVANPGFETGTLQSWNTTGDPQMPDWTVVAPGISSAHAAFLRFHAHIRASPSLSQTVQTKPSSTYRFSFQAVTTNTKKDEHWTLSLDIESLDILVTRDLTLPTGNFTYDIPIQAATSNTRLVIRALIPSKNATILLDNFHMAEVEDSVLFR